MSKQKISILSGFCPERVAEIKKLIDASATTSVIGMPGLGISIFLKHLAAQSFGYSIYIDVFGLSNLSSIEFFKTILTNLGGKTNSSSEVDIVIQCKKILEILVQKNERVIIYLGGFDQLKKSFNQEFFHHLRSLRSVNPEKIIFIFGICRRIDSLVSERLVDTDLNMLSSIYYLKPYSNENLKYMLSVYGPKTEDDMQNLFNLSGGNFQLLQLLLRTERLNDPVQDPFIKLSLTNIYRTLTYQQKKILKKVSTQEVNEIIDEYLINVGLVKKDKSTYKIFSPLLEQFLKTESSIKLPIKEAKLLALLKDNIGEVISKDQIFNTIWGNEMDNPSDWALDALIYRLRRNPAFFAKGYVIESRKKQGYVLLKN